MKDMIVDRNLYLGFIAYDSIYGIKINTKANSFIFFYHNHSIIFKDRYMIIYSLQHVHYTYNY